MPSHSPDQEKIFLTLSLMLRNEGAYEIVLVLQGVCLEVADNIKSHVNFNPRLKIIIDSGTGISRARNIAIKASVGDWILLLDDDVYVEKDTIENLSNVLSDNKMFCYGNAFVHNTNNHYVRYYIIGRDLSIWSYNRVCSISLIINRKVFVKVGLFDEKLGSGCRFGSSEESDLLIRALLMDVKIEYLDGFSVYHEKADHSMEKVERYAMGSGALYRKHLASNNIRLYAKLWADLMIRVVFLFSFQRKRYVFLKGFLKGFFEYGSDK